MVLRTPQPAHHPTDLNNYTGTTSEKSDGGADSGDDGYPDGANHLGSGSATETGGTRQRAVTTITTVKTGTRLHRSSTTRRRVLTVNSVRMCTTATQRTTGRHTLMFTMRIPCLQRLSRLQTRQLIHHRIRQVTRLQTRQLIHHRIRQVTRPQTRHLIHHRIRQVTRPQTRQLISERIQTLGLIRASPRSRKLILTGMAKSAWTRRLP